MKAVTAIIPTLTNTQGLNHLVSELSQAQIPAIVIDNNTKNIGFAAAINRGVKQANTEWMLIANDDIETITKDKMEHLFKIADQNHWEAVSPILVNTQGKVENIGYHVLSIGKVRLNFDKDVFTDTTLDGLTMACLLIKKDIFEHVGGLDESFIAYLEDVDFFLRFKKAGYHFGVDTNVKIAHHHLTTSSKIRGFKEKRDFVNWIKIIKKNWSKETLLKYWVGIIVERLRNVSGLIRKLVSKGNICL